jgi:hypothetical protein
MNTSPTLVTPNIGVATGTGLTLTGTSAAIVSVGANGATNPVLNIDASTASVVTGLNIKGQVSGNGIRLSALSSASNENFYIDGKGTGSVYINTIGTGYVEIGNQTAIVSTNSLAFAVSQALFAGKPAFSVDTSVASGATGLVVKAATTGNGVSLTATDSGSNTGMSIDAKGTGGITLNGTATGGITLNGTATGGITLARTTTHSDGTDIVFGTGTGTKIGTATNQRLAFYNSTPAVQPSTTGTTTGFTAGAGSAVDSAATFTGNMGSAAYTIGDIVKALKTLGLLAA